MSTERFNGWVATWLIVIRHRPSGNWIMRGMSADRVGGAPDSIPMPHNDNARKL